MKINTRIFLVTTVLLLFVFLFSTCVNNNPQDSVVQQTPGNETARCMSCHKPVYESYMHTAHANASHPAAAEFIKGNFLPGKNEYYYKPGIKVVMETRSDGFYQVAYKNGEERQATRFDIVIGSGRKAQTYLYWLDDKIYQLPVSWFVPASSWVNSPGYPPHQVRFDRNIPIGCFECHSSSIKLTGTTVEGDRIEQKFDKTSVSYGISCERCHGPGDEHIHFHQANPGVKQGKYIISYPALSRAQKIDVCGSCHSGIRQTLQTTFNFKPGDTLLNHFFKPAEAVPVSQLDVHGNQQQLLQASACYIKSGSLTCTSCHNLHVDEKDNLAIFSQRCMNCHSPANHNFCKLAASMGNEIRNNCIDCHMPALPSKLITLLSNGQASPTPDRVRTHFISIYPRIKTN